MRILLVTPDSKFPNIAMMKLYQYHLNLGDDVGFNINNPEKIYVSIMFSKNKWMVKNMQFLYPWAEIIAGGPGYDPRIRLAPEIESVVPYQELYPDGKYTFGRVTSGCTRRCPFCVVPIQEPDGIRYIMHPRHFYKKGRIMRLLDDNILALPHAWQEVYDFCKEKKCILHMEYFDIRLVTGQIASQIMDLRIHRGEVWFSWDITKDEKLVIRGIERLMDAGAKGWNMRCFVYLRDETYISDAKYRWNILRKFDVYPFIMTDPEHRTRRLREIQKIGSRPARYKKVGTERMFE